DWAFWMNDDNMSRAPEGFTKTSFGFNRKIFSNLADKVTRYEWGREVAPGITAVETSGHTPGHTSFVIASGASQLFFQGDVTNVPALFLRTPDWQACSTTSRRRPWRRAGASTTWLRPTSSWSRAITSRSPGSATSRRPAAAIGSSRRRGTR